MEKQQVQIVESIKNEPANCDIKTLSMGHDIVVDQEDTKDTNIDSDNRKEDSNLYDDEDEEEEEEDDEIDGASSNDKGIQVEEENDDVDEIDEEEMTVKSDGTDEEGDVSISEQKQNVLDNDEIEPRKQKKRRTNFRNVSRKGRTPSVKGLSIPFRTVKKAMKLDPDTPIVQNEAAIMTTYAVELFLQKLAKDSFLNAKVRGRNTVRYEDVAEARTNRVNLNFLETLLP